MRGGAIFAAAFLFAGCSDEPLYDGLFCTETVPCPDGFMCGSGICHRLCAVNDDCVVEGEVCVSGICTPLVGPGDGGTVEKDGGVEDGGVPDAIPDECTTASDCTSPGPCELAAGAECDQGACVYVQIACVDPPPAECASNDTHYQTY